MTVYTDPAAGGAPYRHQPAAFDPGARVVRGLTVRQPWAWAIAHAGKSVENRSKSLSWCGPVAIHAGLALADDADDPLIRAAWRDADPAVRRIVRGAIIAVADLVDCHPADDPGPDGSGCCPPWGRPGGFHLVLDAVWVLDGPVECVGRLGLWPLTPHQSWAVHAALPALSAGAA